MKDIKINLNNDEINEAFQNIGIVKETITAYYEDFFSESQEQYSFIVDVAYKKGERPDFLNDKYPSLTKAREYSVDNMISKLVSHKIVQMF